MKEIKFKKTEIGNIPEDWEVDNIQNLYTTSSGLSKPKEDFGEGYPFLSFMEVFNNFSLPKELTLLVNSNERERLSCSIQRGDVFLTRTSETQDELGMSSVALKDYKDATFNGFTKRLRPKNNKILPEFAAYLFRSKKIRDQILAFSSLTTRASLNSDMIYRIHLVIPPILEQQAIAQILSFLDAKIEINNKMNKTLESIGQVIFKRWFADFEFPDKNGKPYKSSGGKIIESELGMIPEGWKVGKLGEIGKIQPGFAFKSLDFQKEGYKLIKIRNIQSPIIDIINVEDHLSEEIFKRIDPRFHLSSGDTLIAMTGPELGKVGIIQRVNKKMLLNQRVGKAVSDYPLLFYLHLISQEVQGVLSGIASASSAQGNVSNSDIEKIEIVLPKKEVLELFTKSTSDLFNKLIDNLAENQILSQIRDLLLPKLMSGEIRVPIK